LFSKNIASSMNASLFFFCDCSGSLDLCASSNIEQGFDGIGSWVLDVQWANLGEIEPEKHVGACNILLHQRLQARGIPVWS
jgi:hypothetical protein